MRNVSEFQLILKEPIFEDWSIYTILNTAIEKLILLRCKATGYGGNPRGNLRLFAALGTSLIAATAATFLYVGLQHIFPINSTSMSSVVNQPSGEDLLQTLAVTTSNNLIALCLAIIATAAALFWNERSTLYDKWKYSADLYNLYTVETNLRKRKILMISLCLDLIDLGMWNHSSYKTTFKNGLVKSLAFHNNIYSPPILPDRKNRKGKPIIVTLTLPDARRALQAYQHRLLKNSDFPRRHDFIASKII